MAAERVSVISGYCMEWRCEMAPLWLVDLHRSVSHAGRATVADLALAIGAMASSLFGSDSVFERAVIIYLQTDRQTDTVTGQWHMPR